MEPAQPNDLQDEDMMMESEDRIPASQPDVIEGALRTPLAFEAMPKISQPLETLGTSQMEESTGVSNHLIRYF